MIPQIDGSPLPDGSPGTLDSHGVALIHAGLGDADAVIEWLERAADEENPWIDEIGVLPMFKAFRTDPRFIELARRERLTVLPG